jgi:polysaccharide chain length determinant protein (PEP-CTERM system associated)
MDEIVNQFKSIVQGIVRFKWLAIITSWIICILGWGIVWMLPNVYEARAKVYVDTESVLKPLLSGLAVNSDVTNQLKLMQSYIMSRPNLERVARDTDLALRATTPAEFERLVASLPTAIGLQGGGRDQIFSISFRDPDRAMAQRIVEAMLDTFVEDSIGMKQEDASGAQRFLENQIREYETKLREAETRLADFKRNNVGLMPGEGGDYYTRLQAELTVLEGLQVRARQAAQRRSELSRQLEGEEPTVGLWAGAGGSVGNTAVDAKIAELKRKLDVALLQLTDKHPDIIAIREQISQLEERKRTARSRTDLMVVEPGANPEQNGRSLAVNPVYQSMKIALSQAEVELTDLSTQLIEQQRAVATLRGRVNTMPKVEAELAQLNRDYEVNRSQYTALLQRLESAKLSQQAQQTNDQVRFRVVEPPASPRLPVGPNRVLLMAGVLILSIGSGLALTVVLNLFRPVFGDKQQLIGYLNVRVIGSVMRAPPEERLSFFSRERMLVAGSAGSLLVVFSVLCVYAMYLTRQLVL